MRPSLGGPVGENKMDDFPREFAIEAIGMMRNHFIETLDEIKTHIIDAIPKTICPECKLYKPDDERVRAGMKCESCAY